ncbi:MAG: hypothetical protein JO138_06705 [Acidobacteriaceae bacterium]|nr:hypothetical protein [Acidobacteriaceae bacterium]
MKHKYPVVGHVEDVDGALWGVRDVRGTKHGFDLLFGSPVSRFGSYVSGLPRLIATQPLVDFWEKNRTKHNGLLFDLPAGRTTLKRVRSRLGFHYFEDTSEFFTERFDDLKTLSTREFTVRHNVHAGLVSDTRLKIVGRRARHLGWWHEPKALEVLRSNVPLRVVGEKLGISISQAHRLRNRVREEDRAVREWELAA